MALFPCFKTAPASPGVRRAIPGGAAFARAVLLGCLLLALAGMARAQQAALSGFEWTTPEDRIEFQLRFTAAPTMRVTDDLAAKHYFYLDFTNVSGPAEEARWNPPSPLIEHVRRVYYPQQKVLRFVFYTNKDIRFDAVARGEREFEVVVSPIRITPLAEAGRTGGATQADRDRPGPRRLAQAALDRRGHVEKGQRQDPV
jgi:hypothetical protein